MALAAWGLRKRAIVSAVTLIIASSASVGSALVYKQYRDSLRMLRTDAIAYAQAISRSVEPAVLLGDEAGLAQSLRAAIQHRDVCNIHVLRPDGGALARALPAAERHCDLETWARAQLPTEESLWHLGRTELAALAPIWRRAPSVELDLLNEPAADESADKPVGYVLLTHSLQSIHSGLAQNVLSAAVVTAIVSLVGIVLAVLMVKQLLGPLHNLAQTVHGIAEGHRSARASENAVAEVGALARSFNRMADRLQESYASIERTVEQRTEELRRAKDAAEEANRAKSDFLANMSHEIRTPMTAILGFAEALSEQDLSAAEKLDALRTIHRNGEHLLGIINDILDISKIEAGKLDVERLHCALPQLLAEIESLMRIRASAKGIGLVFGLDGQVPEVIETDPVRLRQILINLIGNAIKFTDHGEVRVVARRRSARPPAIEFDVIDTGVGIPPGQLGQLFQPFTQADESMTRRHGGTGLGLCISKRLALLLGGDITVQSEPGRGSRFTAWVACGATEGVAMLRSSRVLRESAPHNPPDADSPAPLALRILLAEDGVDNQRLIVRVLRKAGAEVAVVDNGADAVRTALQAGQTSTPFDLILMDMQMPGTDGYTATRSLRRAGYDRPIIALTAHAMSGDRERCLAAGCDEYATKPLDRRALLRLIRRVCGGQPAPAA